MEERFWSKVDRSAGEDGCWPWTGAKRQDGYGVVRIKGVLMKAHRVAWAMSHGGQIHRWFSHSWSLVVDHLCGNKGCCNPKHLEAVTQSVNTIRYMRSRFTGLCANGHAREYGKPCPECAKQYQEVWRGKNRDRYLEISRESYRRCKERRSENSIEFPNLK